MDKRGYAETDARYLGWRVVAASAAALAFGPSTIAVLSLGLFMGSFQREFGWPRTEVALATTIVSYVIVVVSPLQGWLIDRFGARRIILWSIPAFGLGVAALSQLQPVHWMYYAAWVAIPFLGVGLFPLGYLKVISGWFDQRLGLALGLANSGVAIGSILIPIIVGLLIHSYGWRQAYIGLGIIVLLFTLPLVWIFVHENGEGPQTPVPRASLVGATFSIAVRTRTFTLLAIGFLLVGVATTAIIVHQVPLLTDAGMSPRKAALVQTVFGIFGLMGRLVAGALLDRFRATRVMIVFVIGGVAACSMYAMGAGGNLAFLCSALIGLLFGTEFDVLAYMIKRHYGMRSFGKIYGVVFAVFQFGAGFGAALLPLARDHFGSYAAGLWVFAALLIGAVATFAGIDDFETVHARL
jgi:MFS family permease